MRSILGRPSQYRCNVRTFILGIETSCDDTGVAVIDQSGERIVQYSGHMINTDQSGSLLSERIHSQASVRMGGVIPTFAMHSHASVIHSLVTETLEAADLSPSQLSAVAVTNRPGLKARIVQDHQIPLERFM